MSFYRDAFTAQSAAVRTRFGAGLRRALPEEMARMGVTRALLLSTPEQRASAVEMADLWPGLTVGIFDGAVMHTPVAVSEQATDLAVRLGADVLVAIGGGSTTGLSKAIALRTDLPQIVIPTTYAGSEATAILGQTEGGVKTTITTAAVQPEVILYDPELVTGLPRSMTVTSALNAMAHAIEGLYARDRSPISGLMALEGVRAFRDAMPRVLADPADLSARGETLYGAWLCGTVLGQVGMALHHKLCHTLGGSFDLPHAATHAIVLPHAIAFNSDAATRELAPLRDLLGPGNPGHALQDLARQWGAPLALRDLGLAEADLDRAAELACANPYWNPRPFGRQDMRLLLQAAWAGERPAF